MRTGLRTAAILLATSLATGTSVGVASADKPLGGCDNDSWQTSVFPRDWAPGQSYDPNGLNTMHQATLNGLVAEFGSIQAALDALGLNSLDDVIALELQGSLKIDRNTDGVLCWKPFSPSGNKPAFILNAVDNTANH